jgi:subtilisin family serine protease
VSDADLTEVRRMLFEGLGGRRYTQASPILPNVWLAFGARPDVPQDMLLTPHREARAGLIARDLRLAVERRRARLSRARRKTGGAGGPARVAHMPGLVAANLRFGELVTLVLPATQWWGEQIAPLGHALGREPGAAGRLLPLIESEVQIIGAKIDELMASRRAGGAIFRKGEEFSHDLLWIVALVGTIAHPRARRGTTAAPTGLELTRAFNALFEDAAADHAEVSEGDGIPVERSVWQVALNRPTEAAVAQSCLAVKADAARRLFNISCRRVTWAIIDSGIDRTHPAFWDWGDERPPAAGEVKPSRVDRTYDFTQVRTLLDPAATARLFQKGATLTDAQRTLKERFVRNLQDLGVAEPEREAPRQMRELRDRLQQGLELDWGLLEPLLRVADPQPPSVGHGTHVAGILGADWRVPNAPIQDGPGAPPPTYKVLMQGVCPDIRLYDMRVLSEEEDVREFEVIAALQFIAHLNRRADARLVHGANLSLSTPHDVANHACGSTPVCEACDSLWSSGVVLVAAAGNHGHQRYRLADDRELGGYHAISITDPGNAEGVITVGSTHSKAHQYGVSYFSSRGPTGDGRRKPDLVAPGEKITAPLPDGAQGEGMGTSCAAPHVSGAAAMLMARFEELRGRPARIKQILCATATDLGREPYFQGAGMLDILRALQSI